MKWLTGIRHGHSLHYQMSFRSSLCRELQMRQQAQIKAQQAAAEVQQEQIASQRAQISRLRDRDAQRAHTLQTVAAQMTVLQNKLARLEGNVSDLRQASKTALAGANGGQVTVRSHNL